MIIHVSIYIVELCLLIAVYLVVSEETRNMKSLVDSLECCKGLSHFRVEEESRLIASFEF